MNSNTKNCHYAVAKSDDIQRGTALNSSSSSSYVTSFAIVARNGEYRRVTVKDIKVLRLIFPGRLISPRGFITWPAWSLALIPLRLLPPNWKILFVMYTSNTRADDKINAAELQSESPGMKGKRLENIIFKTILFFLELKSIFE